MLIGRASEHQGMALARYKVMGFKLMMTQVDSCD